ncbi:hypothetical protein V8C26DRAFT_343611 [Trichoderma gracile]
MPQTSHSQVPRNTPSSLHPNLSSATPHPPSPPFPTLPIQKTSPFSLTAVRQKTTLLTVAYLQRDRPFFLRQIFHPIPFCHTYITCSISSKSYSFSHISVLSMQLPRAITVHAGQTNYPSTFSTQIPNSCDDLNHARLALQICHVMLGSSRHPPNSPSLIARGVTA